MSHRNSMRFSLTATTPNRAPQKFEFSSDAPVSGDFYCPIQGDVDDMSLRFIDRSPYPATISGLTLFVNHWEGV